MTEPVKGQAYEFYLSLTDIFDPQFFVSNPTLAAGDFKVSKDGGALVNLATLPAVTPTGSSAVKVNLNAVEMNADSVVVEGKDVAGDQWGDVFAFIDAPAGSSETVLDLLEGDKRETNISQKVFKKGTATLLLDKTISGSLLQSDITIETLEV